MRHKYEYNIQMHFKIDKMKESYIINKLQCSMYH